MLTEEQNELLCRVGPGTPMGNLMRHYWLPFLHDSELKPNDSPLRVRLLGEDLVAFRQADGTYGLIGDRCEHRSAGLFFGRTEGDGLRCIYHGWKYNASGACIDMPNEVADSNFKSRICIKAYRCVEFGGMVWAYMGLDQANPPGLPQFEWATLPETQRNLRYSFVLENNWLQGLEGDIDSSHIAFLHNRNFADTTSLAQRDRAPAYKVVDTEWGTMGSATRRVGDGNIYHRIYQFVFPFHSFFAGPGHMWVPIDDEHTLVHDVSWDPAKEIADRRLIRDDPTIGAGIMLPEQKGRFFANWWAAADWNNDFLIDREAQRTRNLSGMTANRIEDGAMTISMGRILDRRHEHLVAGDLMIVAVRRRLLEATLALRDRGTLPPTVDHPELCKVRGANLVLPEGEDWVAASADWCRARTIEQNPAQKAFLAASRG